MFDLTSGLTIIAHFNACESVPTEEIVGPSVVDGGSIWQYTFPSEFTNTSEWSVSGGEILFTSSLENTIAIQWNFGSGEGQIVLSQYNFEGVLECLYVNIQINEAQLKYDCVDGDCVENQAGQYMTLDDCLVFCDNTGIFSDVDVPSDYIAAFPSPAASTLNIIMSSQMILSVTLYDFAGRPVYSCSSCAGRQNNTIKEIDVSNFSSGAYLLAVDAVGGAFFQKITIAK